jgi:DNA-binding Lrp family transcriptional regulator
VEKRFSDGDIEFGKIIAAIDRYGIRNISQLARVTHIPTETVRYKVSKQFRRFGLVVDLLVSERRLGLQKYFVEIELKSGVGKINERSLFECLHEQAYLFCGVKELLGNRFSAIFLVPPSIQPKWLQFIEWLRRQKTILTVDFTPFDWSRSASVNSRFLNLKSGKWVIDWGRLSKKRDEIKEYEIEQVEKDPQQRYDSLDMLILRELHTDVTQALSDIADKLKINKKTLSYHYRKHVKAALSGYGVRWVGVNSHENSTESILARFTFKNVRRKTEIAQLREVFSTLPFTNSEYISKEGGVYSTDVLIPAANFTSCLRYLGGSIAVFLSKMRMSLLDRRTEVRYPIPYKLFKDEEGWVFDKQEAINRVSKVVLGSRISNRKKGR